MASPEIETADPTEGSIDGMPGPPWPLTCPECGGTLRKLHDEGVVCCPCHVGHRFNPRSMASAQLTQIENAIWRAIPLLEEGTCLRRRRLAAIVLSRGMAAIAAAFRNDAEGLEGRAAILRGLVMRDGQA